MTAALYLGMSTDSVFPVLSTRLQPLVVSTASAPCCPPVLQLLILPLLQTGQLHVMAETKRSGRKSFMGAKSCNTRVGHTEETSWVTPKVNGAVWLLDQEGHSMGWHVDVVLKTCTIHFQLCQDPLQPSTGPALTSVHHMPFLSH